MAPAPPTPLLPATGALLKCEHLNPTGSFKDRIAAAALELGLAAGARGWVGASSGNAGVAFAAAGARAGLGGVLLTSEGVAPLQLAHMRAFGARVLAVPGFGRDPAVDAAVHSGLATLAAERELILAVTTRAANPAAMDAAGAIAEELVAQLGRAPGAVYVPTGGGGLLASLGDTFARLRGQGEIERVPRLVAVQAEGCAPIHAAFRDGAERVTPAARSTTRITAISLTRPPDGDLALAAVRASGGFTLAPPDAAAFAARDRLAREQGLLVEPAAALAYAACLAEPAEDAVAILTGAGLKSLAAEGDAEPPPTLEASDIPALDLT